MTVAEPDPADRPPVGPVFEKRTDNSSRAEGVDVGDFRQGTPGSRWALARYLVGRAIAESVGTTLMVVALALVVLAVLVQWLLHLTVVTVLLAVVVVGVLLLRAVLMALLRRLTAVARYGPMEQRLRHLVGETRGDVRRELRRIGLPSHLLTMPLLAFRLVGRRRSDTLTRLRSFEVDRAVPAARLDEFHLLLRDVVGRSGRS